MMIFGVISPKLIAKVTTIAVMPSAIVALIRSNEVCEPPAICRRPLAILNKNTPGIIDTTEAKPIAANGMCARCATGVSINPTVRQAMKAPVAAPAPSTVSAAHRRAWAAMPTATGQGSMFMGVEKKTL